MSNRIKLPFKSSSRIVSGHPIFQSADDTADLPLDDDAGAVCEFRVFDPAKVSVFSALEAIGQTVWSVSDPGDFEVGDQVEATSDDDSILVGTLTDVSTTNGTITSDTALLVAASAGNQVRVRLGPVVSMTEFGTANVDTRKWGYEGALASNHAGLEVDLEIDIEVTGVGLVAGGADWFDVICAIMKNRDECD